MTVKQEILEFSPLKTSGEFEGKVGAYNPRNKSWYIADTYTKGQTTVITHIIKEDKFAFEPIITLGTKETRYTKKVQPAPDFPKEV